MFLEQDDAADAAAVKQLRAAIRVQLARVEKESAIRAKALHAKYDAVLAQAQAQLTQRQRLDDAVLVQTKREEVAAAWLAGVPAPVAPVPVPVQPKPVPVTNSGTVRIPQATKERPFENSLGMKFVPVPGTDVLFCISETRVRDYQEYAKAKTVDSSWTKQEQDGVPVGREPEHPVCGMNWDDANGFCQWLTEKETAEGKLSKGARYRLPTDLEWSRAVGLPQEVGKTPKERSEKNQTHFPWGTGWPPKPKSGNYPDSTFHETFPLRDVWIKDLTDGFATTAPVGSFEPNRFGIYDLGGNLWEWCEDTFESGKADGVLRGASWSEYGGASLTNLLSSRRVHFTRSTRRPYGGFRCVLSASRP